MAEMTRSRTGGLLAALNEEWRHLVDQRLDGVAGWVAQEPSLSGCTDLAEVLERVRQNPDPVLWMLLARCAAGDQMAGRVVLQAMLGKLVKMARLDHQAGLDDYVGAMWVCIRTYPLARRTHRVAANLALDSLKAVQRDSRCGPATVTPYPPSLLIDRLYELAAPAVEEELTGRRVLAAAGRLGLVQPEVGAVLTSVYVDGLSSQAAGARHGQSAAMIRYRCSTTVRKLARHAHALAEAA